MTNLITVNGNYRINQVLSSRFPFRVYKSTDNSGKKVIIKTFYEIEDTITSKLDTFHTFMVMT